MGFCRRVELLEASVWGQESLRFGGPSGIAAAEIELRDLAGGEVNQVVDGVVFRSRWGRG